MAAHSWEDGIGWWSLGYCSETEIAKGGEAMTKLQWEKSLELEGMLYFLSYKRRLTQRKARLFMCACCRRIWRLFWHETSHRVVELSEQFADGLATQGELYVAAREAERYPYPF